MVEKNFKQSEAIINSMTMKERRDPDILERLAPPPHCRWLWHGSAGCEPPDQAVPRSAEDDEDVAKDGRQRVGEVVWVATNAPRNDMNAKRKR
jgi:hypothetical protein